MKKNIITTRSTNDLARALGLSPSDAAQMEFRRRVNEKIVHAVAQSKLTHTQVAAAAHTSRSRLTAILNRNTAHVSTDLLLRILAALGYRLNVTFTRERRAA